MISKRLCLISCVHVVGTLFYLLDFFFLVTCSILVVTLVLSKSIVCDVASYIVAVIMFVLLFVLRFDIPPFLVRYFSWFDRYRIDSILGLRFCRLHGFIGHLVGTVNVDKILRFCNDFSLFCRWLISHKRSLWAPLLLISLF